MAKEGYLGRAGQLAVMAEFLLRGYNVNWQQYRNGWGALPELS